MASAASLRRSSTSFRRQGSSGMVWSEGSIPALLQGESAAFQNAEDQKPIAPSKLMHSRSTGFIETRQPHFQNHKSGNAQPDASRKPRFRLGKWIKQFLRKSG